MRHSRAQRRRPCPKGGVSRPPPQPKQRLETASEAQIKPAGGASRALEAEYRRSMRDRDEDKNADESP